MNHRLLCLALLAAVAGGAEARTLGSLEFEPCTLTAVSGQPSVEAHCARLAVPEDPTRPEGRSIELAIGWIPADADEPEADPVLLLAGGPGQGARASYPGTAAAFSDIRRKRHIVLVDQRGTGGSNPLYCRDVAGNSALGDTGDDSLEASADFAKTCRDQLSERADLRFYTTTDAVRDLDRVREAIGAAQLNLVGVSYGTRVAQQYAMRHPAQTRSLVLDGVVPNALILGSEHARNLEASLDQQFERCAAEPACAGSFNPPRTSLDAVMALAKAGQTLVRYRDPSTHALREDVLQPHHVAGLVRMYAYLPQAAAMLPLLLHEASHARPEPLMAQARMILADVGEQIAHGMQLSVLCTEDMPELRADPADADSLLGIAFVEHSLAQCAVWPTGERPQDFHTPLKTDTPTLLLSGEFDPVTPPRYGDAVAEHLPKARHLVLRGAGHGALAVGCTPKLLARFLDTLDAAELDAACLDRLPYAPPFTGFHGWEP